MVGEREGVLLIQFARSPEVGQVKTRMMPALSAVQACELHCELMRWTARHLVGSGLGPVQLSVAGSLEHPVLQQCLDAGAGSLQPQSGADLGERMYRALETGLQCHLGVVLVGSDCPAIDSDYLAAAIDGLANAPVVLGPAMDGGYVLIAARQVDTRLFEDIQWGTDTVYRETVNRLETLGLGWVALPALQDIDRPEDLPAWHELRGNAPAT